MESLSSQQSKFDDTDPWGGGANSIMQGKLAFCRLFAVNAEQRTCSIKTYSPDEAVNNGDYENVQWLSPYTSTEGDEISLVPQLDSTGICIFHGGVPFIIGFFNPVTLDSEQEFADLEDEGVEKAGASAAANKEKINEGDFIFRTAGNCRIVLRRGGEIEFEATKRCRRTYFPTQNLINEQSQNYEFRTDGGSIDWVHLDPLGEETRSTQLWRDDINSSNIVVDIKGTVELDKDVIHRFFIAPGEAVDGEFEAVYWRETLNTGETRFLINENKYDQHIKEDGEETIGINGYTYYSNIKPTGEYTVNINNNFQQIISPDGSMKISVGIEDDKVEDEKPVGGKAKVEIDIDAAGEYKINVNDKASFTMRGDGLITMDTGNGNTKTTIDPAGNITMETTKAVTATAEKIDLQGGQVILGKSPSDVVPLGRLMMAGINLIVDTFNTHTHMHPIPQHAAGSAPTAPPAKPAQALKEDVLSQTVKVQP